MHLINAEISKSCHISIIEKVEPKTFASFYDQRVNMTLDGAHKICSSGHLEKVMP